MRLYSFISRASFPTWWNACIDCEGQGIQPIADKMDAKRRV
jgi:hypothetical protein